ncbi:MAG: GTP-binding protein, partial [Alphaproteobacteria bacterium]
RVPASVREAWKKLIEGYLESREELRGVVVIVDARRGLEPDDESLLEYLDALGHPAVVVASKVDKLGQGERQRAMNALRQRRPGAIAFSALSGEGETEVWRALAGLAR